RAPRPDLRHALLAPGRHRPSGRARRRPRRHRGRHGPGPGGLPAVDGADPPAQAVRRRIRAARRERSVTAAPDIAPEMSRAAAGRWELLRALGAVPDSPAAARCVGPALGLDPVSDAEHTEAFVLNCPPYAAIYLGPQGAIGGEGADRVAGFWRAIGIAPPAEPDHLAALLGLYARLGEAAAGGP